MTPDERKSALAFVAERYEQDRAKELAKYEPEQEAASLPPPAAVAPAAPDPLADDPRHVWLTLTKSERVDLIAALSKAELYELRDRFVAAFHLEAP